MLKTATIGISREIWCSNQETGRFDEKLGDSRENRESWQVCNDVVLDSKGKLHTSERLQAGSKLKMCEVCKTKVTSLLKR